MTKVRKGADSAAPKKKKTARKTSVGTRKKTASTAAAKKRATPKKAAVTKSAKIKKRSTVTAPEGRHQLIAETAFLKAERRGFQGGDPIEDWLEAEQEIDGSQND